MNKLFYLFILIVFSHSFTSVSLACALPCFESKVLDELQLEKSDLQLISNIICKHTSENFVSISDGSYKTSKKNSDGKIVTVINYTDIDIIVLTGEPRKKGTRFDLKKKDGKWILLRKSIILF